MIPGEHEINRICLCQVFIGEFVAAKGSQMIIQVDDNLQEYKLCSRGICIFTQNLERGHGCGL